jgi:hypothetical protein
MHTLLDAAAAGFPHQQRVERADDPMSQMEVPSPKSLTPRMLLIKPVARVQAVMG